MTCLDEIIMPAADFAQMRDEMEALRAQLAALRNPNQHEDDLAVDEFAAKMKDKLAYSREVKGRHGWKTANPDYLARLLIKHVEKGDPIDIANFCMMLGHLRPGSNGPINRASESAIGALKAEISHLCAEAFRSDLDALRVANRRLMNEMAALKEWRYSDQELAIKILSYLGFSQEPSKEPYADRRRDHIAEMICQNFEPLRKELAALKASPKVLSAEEVKETGAYWWRRPGVCNRVLVLVYRPDGGDIRMRFFLNGSDLELSGEFIGPIQTPEV